ncbi:phosphate/phosphite/phosphonate ABC transporter substrate-binding protein [Thiomicrorhabdus sp. 6S3-12]|uniref:phosphate/phosphite/phosphonate ABC transporter substrate-binding protein n=1 Tax=Thiomicrorhabdus sp. 6S3-12 TaxID=2819681 RepID=UPI001AAC685A|nr:phosphate/phosphite/phosphonate ABC transporter substrate-binding protein [Thiomicrorhabdus sp. 6S3-12]
MIQLSPLFQFISAIFLATLCAGAYASSHISFAVFPYANPSYIAKVHQPIKRYFEQALKEPVYLISAKDFKSYNQGILQQKYDIIMGAPHMGRLAELASGYYWLGFTANSSYAVITTREENAGKQLKDFKGQQIIMPPKSAIVNYLSRQALQNAGLTPGKDITVIETNSHHNAMLAVINKIQPLGAFGKPAWEDFNPKGKESLRLLFKSELIPGFAVMVNPKLGQERIRRLREAFLNFPNTEAGKTYFANTGLTGTRRETPQDMPQLDGFLKGVGLLEVTP